MTGKFQFKVATTR